MRRKEEITKAAEDIDKAWNAYWHFDGCEGCVGNGCDDCRDCEEASLKSNLYKKARNMEEGFKNIYGITYREYKLYEAPEKIYIDKEGFLDEYWLYDRRSEEDVEYTRTDAFIEKACEWLDRYFENKVFKTQKESIIKDFKKCMEE